ncbi:MAG: hypothetical protein H6724_05500 [Sandaracinus sp.]|nr:hypothetical protein [Sandaracinus sp.]
MPRFPLLLGLSLVACGGSGGGGDASSDASIARRKHRRRDPDGSETTQT